MLYHQSIKDMVEKWEKTLVVTLANINKIRVNIRKKSAQMIGILVEHSQTLIACASK